MYHEKQEVIELWYEHFKDYCILTNFRDHFTSVKVLGKGSFAKVFKVIRNCDQKEFAVKVFNKKLIMEDPTELVCLLYEIKMMRVVKHPRIIETFEIYEGENYIYCLCTLFKGDDLLNALIKKGIQPEEKSLTIAR